MLEHRVMTSVLLRRFVTILPKSSQRGPEVAGSRTSTLGRGAEGKRSDLHKATSTSGVVIDEGKLEGIATWTRGDRSRLGG